MTFPFRELTHKFKLLFFITITAPYVYIQHINYQMHGVILRYDSKVRYIENNISFLNENGWEYFFKLNGGLYSLLIYIFNGFLPIIILQNILICVVLYFYLQYFFQNNKIEYIIMPMICIYSNPSLVLANTILRESLVFSLINLIFIAYHYNKKILILILSIAVSLIRIEFFAILIMIFTFLFLYESIIFLRNDENTKNYRFKKIILRLPYSNLNISFVLVVLLIVIYSSDHQIYTKSKFNISYHNIPKDSFSYEGSNHENLRKKYDNLCLEFCKNKPFPIHFFYEVTNQYIQNNKLDLSGIELMDEMYQEFLVKKSFLYHIQRIYTDISEQLKGRYEREDVRVNITLINELTEIRRFIFEKLNPIVLIFSIAGLFSLNHLLVIAFFSNPVERFMFPSSILILIAVATILRFFLSYRPGSPHPLQKILSLTGASHPSTPSKPNTD